MRNKDNCEDFIEKQSVWTHARLYIIHYRLTPIFVPLAQHFLNTRPIYTNCIFSLFHEPTHRIDHIKEARIPIALRQSKPHVMQCIEWILTIGTTHTFVLLLAYRSVKPMSTHRIDHIEEARIPIALRQSKPHIMQCIERVLAIGAAHTFTLLFTGGLTHYAAATGEMTTVHACADLIKSLKYNFISY